MTDKNTDDDDINIMPPAGNHGKLTLSALEVSGQGAIPVGNHGKLTLSALEVSGGDVTTRHQLRAQQVIKTLRKQLETVAPAPLVSFLLHYFACEALAKLLQGSRKGSAPAKALDGTVNIRALRAALNHFELLVDDAALKRVFEGDQRALPNRSVRKLRDKVVHELSEADINEITRRGPALIADMNAFIQVVGKAANRRQAF